MCLDKATRCRKVAICFKVKLCLLTFICTSMMSVWLVWWCFHTVCDRSVDLWSLTHFLLKPHKVYFISCQNSLHKHIFWMLNMGHENECRTFPLKLYWILCEQCRALPVIDHICSWTNIISRTGLNIREENHIHESILSGFPGNSDEAIVINYFILKAEHYIYLKKLKDGNKKVDSK